MHYNFINILNIYFGAYMKIRMLIINQITFFDFFGLAYQGKDIVFRFVIEYNSLRDFGP